MEEEQNAAIVDLRRPREVHPTARSSQCFAPSTPMTLGHVYTFNALYGCTGLCKSDRMGSLVYNDPPSGAIRDADARRGEAERPGTGHTSSTSESTSIPKVLIVSRSLIVSLILVYIPTSNKQKYGHAHSKIGRDSPARSQPPLRDHAQRTSSSCCSSRRPASVRFQIYIPVDGITGHPECATRSRRNSCAGAFFLRPSSAITPVQSGRTFRCAARVACHFVDWAGTNCYSLSFSFTPGKRKGSWGPLLRLTGKTVCGNLSLCFPYSVGTCHVTSPFGPHRTLQS